MSIFSSSASSSSKFTLFSPQNPSSAKFHFITPLKTPHSSRTSLPVNSNESSSSPLASSPSPILQEKPQNSLPRDEMEDGDSFDEEIMKAKKSLEELLVVRRPEMEFPDEEGVEDGTGGGGELKDPEAASGIDEGLSRFSSSFVSIL